MHVNGPSVPKTIHLESVPCPLGCDDGDVLVLKGYDRLNHLPGVFNVVRCKGCGLMRTNPRPTSESMRFYYPDQYGPYQGTKVAPMQINGGRGALVRRWGKGLFEFNTTRLPDLQPGRALEIGCASGAFLNKLSRSGWIAEGVEFSETAAQSSRSLGFSVYSGPVESAPDPEHLFRLVVGWMVLEHLHDPVKALRKLHRWVEPQGWLVLSVPNAGAIEFGLFKHRWYALHLPNHLFHFTKNSLSSVLEAGGWRIIRIFHQRTLMNLMGSLGFWFKDQGVFPRFSNFMVSLPEGRGRINYFLYPLACLFASLGQTGRMTVWARRTDDS
jgi:2-polyprenyl-3-methyl-5-hydroxy-6-metoxy-1,4-benzoquinol methylase